MAPVVIGVIDIGTNTTRLLVADVEADRLRTLVERRHFAVPEDAGQATSSRLVSLVEGEIELARRSGATELLVTGTAALRAAGVDEELREACRRANVPEPRVLSEREEAELAFIGATAGESVEGVAAVVDVGGGSTELAVGSPGGRPDWWASRALGSRLITEEALGSDPPSGEQIGRARVLVSSMLDDLEPPPCATALAVSGGAASLRRLCGEVLDRRTIDRTLERLLGSPAEKIAAELELAPERVRLIPAALLILEAVGELFGSGLRIARGGMREGLAMVRAHELAAAGSGR
jgi:exopolyphosphatase / guanosine-5'-triphosphate,3'-diphosphate pyrophosphatase